MKSPHSMIFALAAIVLSGCITEMQNPQEKSPMAEWESSGLMFPDESSLEFSLSPIPAMGSQKDYWQLAKSIEGLISESKNANAKKTLEFHLALARFMQKKAAFLETSPSAAISNFSQSLSSGEKCGKSENIAPFISMSARLNELAAAFDTLKGKYSSLGAGAGETGFFPRQPPGRNIFP